MRLDYDRLYIVGSSVKGRSHLAYMEGWSDCIYQVCLPNIPLFVVHPCDGDDVGFPAGREQAEVWDEHYNEVTCPTCLKRAAG